MGAVLNPYENICSLLHVIESLVICTIKAVFIHNPQYSTAHYVKDVQCLHEVYSWLQIYVHTLCRLASFSVPFHNEPGNKPTVKSGAAKFKLDY